MSASSNASSNGSRQERSSAGGSDDEPVLPDVPRDERDVGWGDDPEAGRRDDDWYRRERPPHHE